MKKEISMMREILANMHQEEQNLLLGDQEGWNSVMKTRTALVERLGILRRARTEATNKLEELIPTSTKKEKKTPLEQFLALDDETYNEILLLRDQISALLERINFQNARNQTLFHQVEHQLALNHARPYNPILEPTLKKKKISVTTEEWPKEEKPHV
jgi:flagellar biosynthesis/type III secretory pathway chaperone